MDGGEIVGTDSGMAGNNDPAGAFGKGTCLPGMLGNFLTFDAPGLNKEVPERPSDNEFRLSVSLLSSISGASASILVSEPSMLGAAFESTDEDLYIL